jgi:hypothetical protein
LVYPINKESKEMKQIPKKMMFVVILFLTSLLYLNAKDVTATVTDKRVRDGGIIRVIMEEANGQRWYIDLDTAYMLLEDLAEAMNINDLVTFYDGPLTGRDGNYKTIRAYTIIFINGENILMKFPSSWRNFPYAFDREEYQ